MSVFHRNSDGALMRGATLLITVLMLAVINVWPLLDVGYDPTSTVHVEEPDGSAANHGAAHDHALCGVMGSAHVLPGTLQSVTVTHSHEAEASPIGQEATAIGSTFAVHHSRAPPSV